MNGTNSNVEFNFSFAPGVTEEQALGFEIAGDIWSQHLADSYRGKDLEINIHVEASDDLLADNIVGGAFPAIANNVKYSQIYDAIQNDVTTDLDQIAADNLLDKNKIDALVGGEIIEQNFQTHVTTANLKALGLLKGNSKKLDGYIVVNNFEGQLWNYDYLGTPAEGTLDFLSMAQHEIGHVLGFISGARHTEETVGNKISNMTTMDLFRYSTASAELGINDLTYGQAAFFSVDGRESTIEFTTGEDHQVGHLVESDNRALMSPTIALAERWSITGDDLQVLDAIGWDVVNPGVIDMAEIYEDAQAEVATMRTGDLSRKVARHILSSDAYNWGRGATRASGTPYFWGRGATRASGTPYFQEGYFIELELSLTAANTSEETKNDNSEFTSDTIEDSITTANDLLEEYWEGNSWWDSLRGRRYSRSN
ncbi:MAG: NF038122 family metalloprotease [Cyanobacteria bacterium P01_A01_bin.83]